LRPVNLIPPEERRGESAPTRAGGLAYAVVGLLALVLAGVVALSYFDKRVADREGEAVAVEARADETEARAQSLASFVTFQQIRDARVQTVDSLARSRFDWERVMRETAQVLPRYVWLTNLTGTVAPGIEVEDSAQIPLRASVPGPALELVGCGRSQRDVARLVAALEDIDGVTRVTAQESMKPDNDSAASAESTSVSDECRTRESIPKFKVVASFDEVVPGGAAPTAPTPDPAAPAPGTEAAPTSEQASVASAEQDADEAQNLVPGG